jgi:hypothetical protein
MIDELYLEVNMKLYDQQLMDLLGSENYDDLKDAHYKWVDSAIQTDNSDKENNRKHIFMESIHRQAQDLLTTTILNRTVFAWKLID